MCSNLLRVIVSKYEPKAVCEPFAKDPAVIPYIPFCEMVLQQISARRQTDLFVLSKDREEVIRYHKLPQMFTFRESKAPLPLRHG